MIAAALATGVVGLAATPALAATTETTGAAAWGFDSRGQLGIGEAGSNRSRATAVDLDALGGADLVEVCAGYEHSAALTSDGRVLAWGSNYYGQLADGTTTDSAVPVEVALGLPGGVAVTAIACGDQHVLALTDAGTVYAWGLNFFGQIGDGTVLDARTVTPVSFGDEFDGLTVTAVSAGESQSMALMSDGTVAMWGRDNLGQLGRGDVWTTEQDRDRYSSVPLRSDIPAGAEVTAITAGQRHSLALTSDGAVLAWGFNNSGQLGTGSTGDEASPVRVDLGALTAAGESVVALGGGLEHSVALTRSGRLYAWGQNYSGQLGTGTTASELRPVAVDMTTSDLAGRTVEQVSAGEEFTVALTDRGEAVSWGGNGSDQLGAPPLQPDRNHSTLATRVTTAGTALVGERVGLVTAGLRHAIAVTERLVAEPVEVRSPAAGDTVRPDAVFRGTGEPGASVELIDPAGRPVRLVGGALTARVGDDGTFVLRPAEPLPTGTGVYRVRQSFGDAPVTAAEVELTVAAAPGEQEPPGGNGGGNGGSATDGAGGSGGRGADGGRLATTGTDTMPLGLLGAVLTALGIGALAIDSTRRLPLRRD
ncbi:RCC1 domain-containing protein [Homoserinibacter sp. YIM 151385]|uniref:RCC1 domain-containing protein n=1 Tax=Homoserinibacter sp. YIM 151385 TaxID=2985506 RepID=UPI0022F12A52|nr:hypothetical protein [Homoserinibacter sp. YIM 151385]WBU37141.1 hypothetical protein OF852_09420 [Homoserinibacter sp. YIM 151385]